MNALNLIYITNDPDIAKICVLSGVDRIMVDLEKEGKAERQFGLDTLISNHSVSDIERIRAAAEEIELLVRINPLSDRTPFEVDEALSRGADSIMLPMADDYATVCDFSNIVRGRAKKVLLLETIPAMIRASEICQKDLVDEVHIGLNDMHIDSRLNFMFELMASHVMDSLCALLQRRAIPFGIGGIAPISQVNKLQANLIITQHARLGSNQVIMSRGFNEILCKADSMDVMKNEVKALKLAFDKSLKLSTSEVDKKLFEFKNCISEILHS